MGSKLSSQFLRMSIVVAVIVTDLAGCPAGREEGSNHEMP